MKIELEELNLADIVRSQVQAMLLKQLGVSLPKIVQEMLEDKPRYGSGKESLLREAFVAAIRTEMKEVISTYMANCKNDISILVQKALNEQFSTANVSREIVAQLSDVEIQLRPFKKSKMDDLDAEE
eukprot:gnl/Spiro4/18140_TR9686_c0_g1_i1.p2 gnl/Spiro4/18140_TR9686_c0_g1~~gnl/Spiro4/18140_TR9686_c0_g1_i1.p2  ORF type:complete len:127 (+),score=0.42 gnl/Spiro4/18140_TR9686_c0_g1_i1:1053-1433(+)